MLVEVKQEHIDKGRQEDCFGCPVYHGLAESMGPEFSEGLTGSCVAVSPTVIMIMEKNHEVKKLPTPGPVGRRINFYDRTGKMKPFTFELPIDGDVV